MNIFGRTTALAAAITLGACLAGGCGDQTAKRSADTSLPAELGPTIGSLVRVAIPQAVPVEGYGLVVGLKGTGSAECPPRVRTYLERYILRQLPANQKFDVDSFIASLDTAVVLVEGTMPEMASKGEYFDVKVTALPGTQTLSLAGGSLLETELKVTGQFNVTTRPAADVKGPILVDKIGDSDPDRRTGYILAGGKVLVGSNIEMRLDKPNFRLTNAIRNRINGRFGNDVARAPVPGQIELAVPAKYAEHKQRFVAMVRATFLTQEPALVEQRITALAERLASSPDKYASEVALEAIGNQCLGKLGVLLQSPDELVRLHAARCMLNLGSDAGLTALRQIAADPRSARRLEALEAIVFGAKRSDAAAISRRLLRDEDFGVRLAAYENLRKLDDIAIAQEYVGGSFYMERVAQTDYKVIYASRSGQPRIVLFGTPIYCHAGIFLQSADNDITLNAAEGQQYVTIIRKHPKRPGVIMQVKSTLEVGDIIRTLCDEPVQEGQKERGGLGASYADAIAILKQMCDKGAVEAQFRAGDLPKIGLNVKK